MPIMSTVVMDVINRISKSVANPKPEPWRMSKVNTIGEWGRQGDIYIEIIKKPDANLTTIKGFKGQLAEGDQRGSRHILDPKKVIAYDNPVVSVKNGPILFVKEDTEITHPDHGSVFLSKGVWAEITYQVNWVNDAVSRVRD